MVLPGWECCNKWEAHAGTGGAVWDEEDLDVAEQCMAGEAELLANHPSVVAFLIGSDYAPPPDVAERYMAALRRAGWDLPVVASATDEGTEVTGPSGMKMTGPYDWAPPVYWYLADPELGGAIGFNSETSAGHSVPRLPSLQRMLSPAELDRLWQQPELPQYHSGPQPLWGDGSVFDNLGIFARALAERYGRPRNAEDFVRKAQLACYEAARAQFEAYRARFGAPEPATGVIYWMLNSPWPSLNWQLFDYELDTPGSYWGAHKALEAVHVQYAYDSATVQVLNRLRAPTGPLVVTARSWSAGGDLRQEERFEVGPVAAGALADVGKAEPPEGTEGLWFLELVGSGQPAESRNVYWLSAAPDVLDRSQAKWYTMGVSRFADLRGLGEGRFARIEAEASAKRAGAEVTVAVTVRNSDPSGTPAVAVHVSLTKGGAVQTPVFWDDNDVTLFTGQCVTLRGRLALSSRPDDPLVALVEGHNLYRPVALSV